MHHLKALHSQSLLVLPISGAKELKRHSFMTFATFFHQSSPFLFRQQEPLPDPKSSPENHLQIGASNFSLEHPCKKNVSLNVISYHFDKTFNFTFRHIGSQGSLICTSSKNSFIGSRCSSVTSFFISITINLAAYVCYAFSFYFACFSNLQVGDALLYLTMYIYFTSF
jgi:hypothetical protein